MTETFGAPLKRGLGGDAWGDGIDRGGQFFQSHVSESRLTRSRSFGSRPDWGDCAWAHDRSGRRGGADLQLCNTVSIDWGRWRFGPGFVWRSARISGYPGFHCLGGFAGGRDGSWLAGPGFAWENNRVGRRGQTTWWTRLTV